MGPWTAELMRQVWGFSASAWWLLTVQLTYCLPHQPCPPSGLERMQVRLLEQWLVAHSESQPDLGWGCSKCMRLSGGFSRSSCS